VNEHLKEIRSGFLRQIGGVLLLWLLAIAIPQEWTARHLLASEYTVRTIRYSLIVVGVFWVGRLSCSIKIKRIKILNATWTTQHAAKDVTEIVRKEVEENGKRDIVASNEFLGGDPHYGCLKNLSVEYTKFGLRRHKTVPENTHLIL
jgi:hypothetical protein